MKTAWVSSLTLTGLLGPVAAMVLPEPGFQAPLGVSHAASPPPPPEHWSRNVEWQDYRTCNANSSQFTGKVPVTPGKELFFWFVQARDDPLNKPTLLWLNGGPGGSSIVGLFEEIGPCEFESSNKTRINPHSWANFANLLFLDQPASVGFSTVKEPETAPVTLGEASVDFSKFLHEFTNRYDQYFTKGLYFAGESFGGRYIPRFTSDITHKQLVKAPDALQVPIQGVILVNALVDHAYPYLGHYELFCTGEQDLLRFNESACADIAAALPELENLQKICQATYDPCVCSAVAEYGQTFVYKYFQEEVAAKRRSPYDLRLGCDLPPICIPRSEFSVGPYLSDPKIQKLLGIKKYQKYESINFPLNTNWSQQPEISLPTTKDVTFLLDEAKIRVLVLNGNYDVIVNSAGIRREYDELPWSNNIQYRLSSRGDWFYTDTQGLSRKGGDRKGIKQLQYAGVDNAGHMSPGEAKEPVSFLVRQWMEEKGGF